jgi:DNA-binding transcriptional LysR family regulator
MTMIRHLARFGVGIAVVDDFMASGGLDWGPLEIVLPGWTLEPMPMPISIPIPIPIRVFAAKTRAVVDL